MFLGEYRLSVEGAGWLTLPPGIRNALHELYAPDDDTLILSMFFERCLVCYPRVEWLKVPERLRSMGASPIDLRDFQTRKAVCLLDGEGRFYIPLLFRQYAQLERDALLIGMVCCLELWSPHQWERFTAAEG
jgi:MraZ protein